MSFSDSVSGLTAGTAGSTDLARILERERQSRGMTDFSASRFQRATELLTQLSSGEFQDFLTTSAYADLALNLGMRNSRIDDHASM